MCCRPQQFTADQPNFGSGARLVWFYDLEIIMIMNCQGIIIMRGLLKQTGNYGNSFCCYYW